MACEDENEMTSQQRAGLVIWLMGRGHSFTTMEIAHITGLGYRGAKHMMDNLSGKVPLQFEHSRWRLLTDK
jgi:hypothetical protein